MFTHGEVEAKLNLEISKLRAALAAREAEVGRLREALGQSFRGVELPSTDPVTYVGVYVVRWGQVAEPTIAFNRWTDDDIAALTDHTKEK